MAKKRKKNEKLLEIVSALILLLGVAASVILMFKAFNFDLIGSKAIEGFKVAFGDKDLNLKFELITVITILLPAFAGVISFLLKNKLVSLFSLVLIVIHVILLFTLRVKITTNFSFDLKLTTLGYIAMSLSILEGLLLGLKSYIS